MDEGGRDDGRGGELILNESSRLAGLVCGGSEAGDQVKLITAGFLIALYL